jgi:hypothetical protein
VNNDHPIRKPCVPLISRGIPVFPLPPRSKAAKLSDWQNLASTDHSRIKEWSLQGPEDNCAAVAQACAGGFWFLDIDRPDFTKTIEEQTGQKIPPTMMVRSQPGKLHTSANVDGRKVPWSLYYVGRGKDGEVRTSTKPHNAALMTEALAELLVAKFNVTGNHAEVCELLADETSTIHDSLVDIGDAERTSGVLVRGT